MATLRSGYMVATVTPSGKRDENWYPTYREAVYHYNDYKWLKLHYHAYSEVLLYGLRLLKDGNTEYDLMRSYPER